MPVGYQRNHVGLSGLTNAYRSVTSAVVWLMRGASRWLEAEARPAGRAATPRANASEPATRVFHTFELSFWSIFPFGAPYHVGRGRNCLELVRLSLWGICAIDLYAILSCDIVRRR